MTTNLLGFLSEAADQRDDSDVDQGVVAVIAQGLIIMYGYVESVSPELLTLERIKRVNNAAKGHLHMHPYLHHFPLGQIVMARYADLTEVNR